MSILFYQISFCIGDKTLEINKKSFTLGELSAEFLNLPKTAYADMRHQLDKAEEKLNKYSQTKDIKDWLEANNEYCFLDKMMCKCPFLSLLKDNNTVLKDTEIELKKISENKSSVPENIETIFDLYKNYCNTYAAVLLDIEAFNTTVFNFIDLFLSKLIKLNAENYAAALCDFLNDPRRNKLIVNPLRNNSCFTSSDEMKVKYVPRETKKDSDTYKIYEYYDVFSLQALLKADFYHALMSGFVIRKCKYCGRYFLLTKGYHTKYCDRPAPDKPQFTCAQLGYHYKGIKELAEDNPKAQSLKRCCLRIDKDLYRGIITEAEKEKIYKKAKDLYHFATVGSGVSNEEFEKQLASKNLYSLCNVKRKANPVGRPKKVH